MLKIYFKRVVNANSSLFSMVVSWKSYGFPFRSQNTPKNCIFFEKKSLNHCLYPSIKYLPKHVWSFLLSVSLVTMCSGHSQCWLFIFQSFFCSKPYKKVEQEEKIYHFFTSQVLGIVDSMHSTRGVFVLKKSLKFI